MPEKVFYRPKWFSLPELFVSQKILKIINPIIDYEEDWSAWKSQIGQKGNEIRFYLMNDKSK